MERKKYKNIDNEMKFITPSDLLIGGDIKINGYNYHLLGADDYSRSYLAGHSYQ